MSTNLNVEEFKKLDLESQINTFKKNIQLCIDYCAHYRSTVEKRPVFPDVMPGYLRKLLPHYPPEEPERFEDMLKDYDQYIIPGTMHWVHPDNYAYFPSGQGLVNIPADMLSISIGGVGFSWTSQPASTELENVMMDWLGRALGLPNHFLFEESHGKGGGVINSSASDSIFSAITAARHMALEREGCYTPDGDETGYHPGIPLQQFVCYTSTEAHTCIEKAANLSLIDIKIITPNEQSKLTGELLEAEIQKDIRDGKKPILVVGTLGSTGGVFFDDIKSLGLVAQKYNMWYHVDAAYAGNALILPEMQHLRSGLELADSIEINVLKMLNGSTELSCLWVKNVHNYKKTWLIDATYLIKQDETDEMRILNEIDYRHYGIPLSHRMRSLKVWFLMRLYGISGLQAIVRQKIEFAKYFESLVRADDRFVITNYPELGVVCFRQKENETSRRNPRPSNDQSYCDLQNINLQYRINKSRKLHLVPSTIRGNLYTLRLSVNYVYQTKEDLDRAWRLIQSFYVDELDDEISKTIRGEKLSKKTCNSVMLHSFVRVIPEGQKSTNVKTPKLGLEFGVVSLKKNDQQGSQQQPSPPFNYQQQPSQRSSHQQQLFQQSALNAQSSFGPCLASDYNSNNESSLGPQFKF